MELNWWFSANLFYTSFAFWSYNVCSLLWTMNTWIPFSQETWTYRQIKCSSNLTSTKGFLKITNNSIIFQDKKMLITETKPQTTKYAFAEKLSCFQESFGYLHTREINFTLITLPPIQNPGIPSIQLPDFHHFRALSDSWSSFPCKHRRTPSVP